MAGPSGFQFEGIISSSFEYVQLNRFKFRSGTGGADTQIYCLLFVHYQGFLLNMLLNYTQDPRTWGCSEVRVTRAAATHFTSSASRLIRIGMGRR